MQPKTATLLLLHADTTALHERQVSDVTTHVGRVIETKGLSAALSSVVGERPPVTVDPTTAVSAHARN